MTVVMTPEKKPFFAGTYFPKHSRGAGRAGMMELVPALAAAWKDRRDQVVESAEAITQRLAQMTQGSAGEAPGRESLRGAFQKVAMQLTRCGISAKF